MTKNTTTAPTPSPTRRRITMERTFEATLDEVWELWTTKEGIESWWGPEGFTVEVRTLDLRPGGEMTYAMTATGAEQAAFMSRAGMPLTTEARLTYVEITPPRRLAYTHVTDFVPGVEAYDVATVVELHASGRAVRMVLTFDAMHDERWTEMAVKGWDSQLGKLAAALAA
jgi:uncharacterized protein YndB with AHSA1/START domain